MEGLSSQGALFTSAGLPWERLSTGHPPLCILRDSGAADSLQVCGAGWNDPIASQGCGGTGGDRCRDSGG